MTTTPPARSKRYVLYDSVRGVVIDKVVSGLAGLALVVLGSTVFPIVGIVFTAYYPWKGYLEAYPEFYVPIILISIATWVFMLRQSPVLAWWFHVIVAAVAFVIAGLMRLGIGLPSVVWVQFLFYFTGILILCEMALILFGMGALRAAKALRA